MCICRNEIAKFLKYTNFFLPIVPQSNREIEEMDEEAVIYNPGNGTGFRE